MESTWGAFSGLGWLLLALLPYLFVNRRLHMEIQAIFLLLTRRPMLSIGLFSLLFLPGVLVHELSHWLVARLLRVRTGRFSILPQVLPGGHVRLGYVETVRSDYLRDALIGMAPLISGGLITAYLGLQPLGMGSWITLVTQQAWENLLTSLFAMPSRPDFWLWFYLAFTVSSTMLPSDSDRRAWQPLILLVLALCGVALLAGAGEWMLTYLAPGLNIALKALSVVFAISLILHLILLLPLWLVRKMLERLTGLRVTGNF